MPMARDPDVLRTERPDRAAFAEKLLQQKVPALFRGADFTNVIARHRNV